jgi:hypothetical protein
MRRARLLALVAAALVLAALVPAATSAAAAPKVAIIVGPAGSAATPGYLRAADAAVAVARTLTPNVVKVYTPNATWPTVKAAVTNASVVVYLGHGNGWPSRYSTALRPGTMDGFGLNPVAGVDNIAHQYFGESFVSKLHLASGAVVLLSHLCYASGSTEPGLADGTFSDILSRVDNFAAGFLTAGAGLVIAEGHEDPASLISAAIHGPAAAAQAWKGADWGHGHVSTYASARTAGASVSLDPDTASSGYYRSMVQAQGRVGRTVVTPSTVGTIEAIPLPPPSLASAGARFGTATISATVSPGTSASVSLPVTRDAAALPASLLVGVRWLPLVAPSTPESTSNADGLVVGESSGDVVQTATATRSGGSLNLQVPAPETPGTYVVLMTLEASDGTPYDVATQALLRPFTVVVPKPVDLRITAPATLAAKPGTLTGVDVSLANTGTQAWGSPLYATIWSDPALDPALDRSFSHVLFLSATWIDTASGAVVPGALYPLPREMGAPGGTADVHLNLVAPSADGQYLLLLSLAVQGSLGEFPQSTLVVPATIGENLPVVTPSAGS